MPQKDEALIILTNDDGIESPGLLAAAHALAPLGWILVAAPSRQQSAMGRSMPLTNEGTIQSLQRAIGDDHWEVYAVDGTPAQSVQHAILELADRRPDLVVSGINYGENVGTGTTISGTIGAALEAASFKVPALAVSLAMDQQYHVSHSDEVDFSAAGYFTHHFAERLLKNSMPPDVDVLKVDVPWDATEQTAWRLTRQSRQSYYQPQRPERASFDIPGIVGYRRDIDFDGLEPESDIAVLVNERLVSVTPLSLDLTSRVPFHELDAQLRGVDTK